MKKYICALSAFAIGLAGSTTPVSAQSAPQASIVIKDDLCFILVFQPPNPPLFIQGQKSRLVITKSGNFMYQCHADVAPDQIPDSIINVDQSCLGFRGGNFVEGIGRVVVNPGGRALFSCAINGSAKVIEFDF